MTTTGTTQAAPANRTAAEFRVGDIVESRAGVPAHASIPEPARILRVSKLTVTVQTAAGAEYRVDKRAVCRSTAIVAEVADTGLWVDDNGHVTCDKHAGMYLTAAIAKRPTARSHRTPLGTWDKVTPIEVAEQAAQGFPLTCENGQH